MVTVTAAVSLLKMKPDFTTRLVLAAGEPTSVTFVALLKRPELDPVA